MTQDLIEYPIPRSTIDKIHALRAQQPRILVVNMFEREGEPHKEEYGFRVVEMLQWITRGRVEVEHYSDIRKDSPALQKADIIAFTGKYYSFTDYFVDGRFYADGPNFDGKFGYLIHVLRNTKKPILGLCAGHQLYALAFRGDKRVDDVLKFIDQNQPAVGETRGRIRGMYDTQRIITPGHLLYDQFLGSNDQLVQAEDVDRSVSHAHIYPDEEGLEDKLSHYNHEQIVQVGNDPKVRILATNTIPPEGLTVLGEDGQHRRFVQGPADLLIPNTLEHVDLEDLARTIKTNEHTKAVITFQYHPERLPLDGHFGGLVLLVNALTLLTDLQLYDEVKRELYSIPPPRRENAT